MARPHLHVGCIAPEPVSIYERRKETNMYRRKKERASSKEHARYYPAPVQAPGSADLPLPSPTGGHLLRCIAFWISPHSHLSSSALTFGGHQALSAYIWLRTNKGSSRSWLHHIGKADPPNCPCGQHTQDGQHNLQLYRYQSHRTVRRRCRLVGGLGCAVWIPIEGEQLEDGVEAFFTYLSFQLV